MEMNIIIKTDYITNKMEARLRECRFTQNDYSLYDEDLIGDYVCFDAPIYLGAVLNSFEGKHFYATLEDVNANSVEAMVNSSNVSYDLFKSFEIYIDLESYHEWLDTIPQDQKNRYLDVFYEDEDMGSIYPANNKVVEALLLYPRILDHQFCTFGIKVIFER